MPMTKSSAAYGAAKRSTAPAAPSACGRPRSSSSVSGMPDDTLSWHASGRPAARARARRVGCGPALGVHKRCVCDELT